MGKGSGIDSINMWLKDVGMQVSEEDAMKVLQAVKLHSLTNKKMLSHAEFRDVARATLGRTPAGGGVVLLHPPLKGEGRPPKAGGVG